MACPATASSNTPAGPACNLPKLDIDVNLHPDWKLLRRGEVNAITGATTYIRGQDAQHQTTSWFIARQNLDNPFNGDEPVSTVLFQGL